MNEIFKIVGGNQLQGEIFVSGAKNSVLKLMAACLLAKGKSTLYNCPQILDVSYMKKVLEGLGVTVTINDTTVEIDVPDHIEHRADFLAASQFRASVSVLGPLVGRCKQAVVALPGGDAIGTRPLDMHQRALGLMGVSTTIEHGKLVAIAHELKGAEISLTFPSHGATENIIMAAVLADGVTVIDNAAREPEIIDLCNFLTSMGAKIKGQGTSTIMIRGVDKLNPVEHEVIGDRLVAATWACGAVMTKGSLTIKGVNPRYLDVVLNKLVLGGAKVNIFDQGFDIVQEDQPKAVNISTLPYPGYPTDLQSLAVAIASIADGLSIITENVFESRFRFVEEMIRMGANVRADGHHVVARGIPVLSSASVWCSDIRAGAGLVLAGLCAEGETVVNDIYHIDRGYPNFCEDLLSLGANVVRENVPTQHII